MELWLPGANRADRAPLDGGAMTGGPARCVWHTTEGDGYPLSTYEATTSWPTVTWNPRTGDLWQHLPADRAARALANPAGGVQTNRMGSVCVQVEVIGHAAHEPLHAGELAGLDRLLAWLDQLGVVRAWPAGSPLPYPRSYGLGNGDRFPALWSGHGGHYGHSQVPENRHGDPGPVLLSAWAAKPPAWKPTPKPPTKPTPHVPAFPRERGDDQLVRLGDKGAEVVAVQRRLRERGWRITVDGKYGPSTAAVVTAFQHEKHLQPDGVVGAATWRALWTTAA